MKPRHERSSALPPPGYAKESRRVPSRNFRLLALLAVTVVFALASAAMLRTQSARAQEATEAAQDQPPIGPGLPRVGSAGPKSAASTSKAGSILFFHKFTSDASKASTVNTLLTLTNTNPRDGVAIHLIFSANCVSEEQFISLGPNQTRTLLMSRERPNATGYAMAIAVNGDGAPTQFNWLIGSAVLRDAHGHEAGYNALAVAKRTAGAAHTSNEGYAELNFDGGEYDKLPKMIALDNLQNQAGGVAGALSTEVTVYSPAPRPDADEYSPTKITAVAYDQSGKPYAEVIDNVCQLSTAASKIWVDPGINSIVTAGNPGWASFSATDLDSGNPVPILGLSTTDSIGGEALHNARNMQVLEWLDKYRITVPVGFISEPPADSLTSNQPAATGGSEGAGESAKGSILVFSRFTTADGGNTQLNVTNTDPSEKVRVRLFFSNLAATSPITDKIIALGPSQTTTIDVSTIAPGQRGWALAMAIDAGGRPTQFNHLIGSAQVIEGAATGEASAAYNALAIAKNSPGPVGRNNDAVSANLIFDGVNYDMLPAVGALSAVASQDDNSTTLGFARPPTTLLDGANTRGSISTVLFDDAFNTASTTLGKTETRLSTLKTNGNKAFTGVIDKGHRGWLKLNSATPLFAWSNTLGTAPFTVAGNIWVGGGLSYGGNLHYLSVSDFYQIEAPASNPGNHIPVAVAEPIPPVIEARRATGTIVRLDGSASSDEDPGDVLTYLWTDTDKPVSEGRVTDLRLGLGIHGIALTVTDGSGATSVPYEQIVTVKDTIAPQISGIPTGITRTTASLKGVAVDYKLPMAYDMVDGWIPVTATRPPGSVFPLGATTVTFTAKDKSGNTATAIMIVNVVFSDQEQQTGGVPGSIAPVLENINDQYIPAGTTRDILLKATDPDNDPVTFSLIGAGSNAKLVDVNAAARQATLRITPSADDPVTEIRVVATDNHKQTFRTLPFRVQVSDIPNDETGSGKKLTNRVPVPLVQPLPSAIQAAGKDGADVSLDGSKSTDADGDSLTFTWTDAGQVIAQGPTVTVRLAVGQHSIALTASDGNGGVSSSSPISVEVLPRTLSILSVSPNRITRGSTMTVTIKGTGIVPGTQVRFGKDKVNTTSYLSVEEDQIVVTVNVEAGANPGSCDVYLITPLGKSVRFRSGVFIAP
ncbi:MAG TPA: HYR domain-containing protein [Blastocatellia bacterium]|nr:HYR domain-containing protein [Blastocatellia bacterium]